RSAAELDKAPTTGFHWLASQWRLGSAPSAKNFSTSSRPCQCYASRVPQRRRLPEVIAGRDAVLAARRDTGCLIAGMNTVAAVDDETTRSPGPQDMTEKKGRCLAFG